MTPINWDKIEALMLKSFTGGGLTETEQYLIQEAYRREPKEYGRRHATIRDNEIETRRRMGR